MNVQAHMSAGWVPNQGGLQQQNGNALSPNQMQNLVGGVAPVAASGGVGVVPQQHNMLTLDPELLRARGFMRDRIFSILLHRQSQPIDEFTRNKCKDISIRLEEGMFKAAHTKVLYYLSLRPIQPYRDIFLSTLTFAFMDSVIANYFDIFGFKEAEYKLHIVATCYISFMSYFYNPLYPGGLYEYGDFRASLMQTWLVKKRDAT